MVIPLLSMFVFIIFTFIVYFIYLFNLSLIVDFTMSK